MIRDLRDYLRFLSETGRLDVIDEPCPLESLGERMRCQEARGKSIWFRSIEGYPDASMVNNLFADRSFLAALLSCSARELPDVFSRRTADRIPPVLVDRSAAPVQTHVYTGDAVNILGFPFIRHAPKDGGRFISAGMVIAKDPETGIRNCSINRMQLKGPDRTGLRMSPRQDLEAYYKHAAERGQRLEVAVAVGNHPADLLAAACGPARDVDELELAGGLRGEPVELVRCLTVDLEVPARAELVIEGYLVPGEVEPEGPFGDFMEYYVPVMDNPVLHITAITTRDNPVLQSIHAGSRDDVTLLAAPREASIYTMLKSMNIDVRGISLQLCNNYLTGAVSIRKQLEDEPRNAMLGAFAVFKFLKNFVVVDHDVNVDDPKEILWAVSTRLRAERGLLVLPNTVGFGRDNYGIHTAKLGIDATAPLDHWDEFERTGHPLPKD